MDSTNVPDKERKMELSKLQKEIINAPYDKVVVIASAASGKTATMTEKVRQIIQSGVNPRQVAVITFTNMAAGELRKRLGADYKDGLFVGTIHSLANYMLNMGGVDTSKILNDEKFDELFELIEENPHCIRHLEWILLDEAQDSDPMQFKFLFDMINPERFFITGDPKQCQPKGTKILLRGGEEKNIEDIKIGDEIVWYNNTNGTCSSLKGTTYNSIHKYVKSISERKCINEFLINIKTENGLTSSYTQNHRTFIKMRADTDYVSVVYLMCDKKYRFRVGKIALNGIKSKNGNPWRTKLRDEGCSKIWLLKAFKTDLEARVYEQKISYFYQIPQTCWQFDKVKWTQKDIDYIYEGIDTYKNAKRCLFDHKLNINLPIIDKDIEWSFIQKFASNASSQLYAINIMPEIMDCLVYDSNSNNHSHKKFEHITGNKIYIEHEIPVYSLEVDGGTYVADGIITHNSIYQWKDADPQLMMDLARRPGVHLFSMNENYRNGFNILKFAKQIIKPTKLIDDSIAMRQGNGAVTETPFSLDRIVQYVKQGKFGDWAILTRTNAEISLVTGKLNREKIPYDTFKQGDLSNEELSEKMKQDTVKVLTIHSAKGLEFENVIVFGTRFTPREERNVCYVAATRARENLIWMNQKKQNTKMYKW